MRRRRGTPSVLAEVSGPASGDGRVWSLRHSDLESLGPLVGELGDRRSLLLIGEGRRTAAIALAAATVAAGRRAALLECDLGDPRLAAELGLVPAPGLHEYLRWEATAPEIVRPLALAGPAADGASAPLVVVPAGRPATDPATLLGLDSFRHATAKLCHAYDLLVLSGPPPDAGAAVMEAVVEPAETVLVAIPSGRSRRALRAATRHLPGAPLGAIVVGEG